MSTPIRRTPVLMLAIAVFLTGTIFGLLKLRDEFGRDPEGVRGTVLWIASEGHREYWRFLDTLGRYSLADESVSRDDLLLRYDILLSQIHNFATSTVRRRIAEADRPEFAQRLENVETTLIDLEPELTALESGDAEAGAAIRERLASTADVLDDLVQQVDKSENAYFVGVFDETEATLDLLSILIMSMSAAGAALIVLLIRESARANRSFEAANEAERRVREMNDELEARVTDRTADLEAEISIRKETETELEAARDAALAAERIKSEFLANMSHEIRTPLTSILGFTEFLPTLGPAEQRKAIETISRNGHQLLAIINDILDLSKVEAGQLTVERILVAPMGVVSQVLSAEQPRATAKGIELEFQTEGNVPETIHTDPVRLRQVLTNVVSNALKFTESGSVRVIARLVRPPQADPRLEFDVVDTGIGMTPEQCESAFRPFHQADNSTTRKFGGTGLGLVISRRFAELLGGDVIVVESRPGVGTRMRISVSAGPIAEPETAIEPATPAPSAPSAAPVSAASTGPSTDGVFEGIRILVVEDCPDTQELAQILLRPTGANITVVEHGGLGVDAALAAERTGTPFDLVLMDMQMPVMDGYEAARALRSQGFARPIVANTAHAMSGDREKCLAAGCDRYTTKPTSREELVETIQSVLEEFETRHRESRPTG